MFFAYLLFSITYEFDESIPISVPIEAMIAKGDKGCISIECPKDTFPSGPCGTRCWYNPKSQKIKPTYEYTFKGEKFQVYGTWDKKHGSMAIYINDSLIKVIDQSQYDRTLYALQYESEILPYGEHKIKIAAHDGDSKFYKLAYWPSVNAIRMNSTEMQPPWGKDSDGIGGLIEWNNGDHYKYKTTTIRCSKIWVYGTKASNHNILKLHIGDQIHTINLHKEGPKINSTLVFESDYIPFDNYLLTFEHNGGIQFSCIYYLPFQPPCLQSKNFKNVNNFILILIFSILIVIISGIVFISKSKKSSKLNNSDKIKELNSNNKRDTKIKEEEQEEKVSNLKFKEIKFIDIDDINELKKIESLGQGTQSEVIKVFNGNYYALKVLKINPTKTKKDGTKSKFETDEFTKIRRFLQEYEILSSIDHPNIIKSYGFFTGDDTNSPSILLQYCPNNLKDVVEDLSDVERITVIYEICLGMKKVHEIGLIHRDLKPENILLDDLNHAKISDFGISCLIDSETQSQSKTGGVGTLLFMAPELLNGSTKYNEKVDVYSFGVVLFFILTSGKYPKISIAGVVNGKKAQIPKDINKVSCNLINKCWSTIADERPSFLEIIDLIKFNNFNLIDGVEKDISKIKAFLKI